MTTNPSLVNQAGLSVDLAGYRLLINEAAAHNFSEVMLQVPTSDAAENAQLVATLNEQAQSCQVKLTIKLPCDPRWTESIEAVQQLGLPILLTGLSNPLQLLWATEKRGPMGGALCWTIGCGGSRCLGADARLRASASDRSRFVGGQCQISGRLGAVDGVGCQRRDAAP